MILVAIVFAFISIIPLINLISGFIYFLTLNFWLLLNGVNPFSGKTLVTNITAMIVEFIPFVSWLPAEVIATIAIIIMVKSQDKLGVKMPALKPKLTK